MENKQKIIVKDATIRTLHKDGMDYICITDITRQKNAVEPKDVVKNWMRSKNTIEYLGLWEILNNPSFKGVEFDPLLKKAGSNAFTLSFLIQEGLPQADRLLKLNEIAIHQMQVLEQVENRTLLK